MKITRTTMVDRGLTHAEIATLSGMGLLEPQPTAGLFLTTRAPSTWPAHWRRRWNETVRAGRR